ncbi:30S ribosomal protein S20 [Candidatus Gottesmanbacteria bacterium]|nr:30S ribosomal protein S20 [Candidatus Gottesmanbacteria bacterium]
MPIIKSAKKKLRQDIKRRKINLLQKKKAVSAISAFRLKPTEKSLPNLYSILDTTSKKHIFHPNKVKRLKARLSKLINKTKKR